MARSFAAVHRLLLNKYYVDEIYDATIVQPIQVVSRGRAVARLRRAASSTAPSTAPARSSTRSAGVLRRLQTGSVRAYAGSLFVGVVLMLGYYLWR